MSGQNLYFPLDQIISAAGVQVGVSEINAGWETRARGSGGFPSQPLGVMWHHTASATSIENDLAWQCHNCPDAPVGNLTIDRDGVAWPVAAGASNCSGKGGPWDFSRGTCPLDSGNTHLFNIECACDGVGGSYSVATIDAYFAVSNALNAYVGNHPTDVVGHHHYTPSRKIDPAMGRAVEGLWQPREINSSGTWDLGDMQNECAARAGSAPLPGPLPPPPGGDDDMVDGIYRNNGGTDFLVWSSGHKMWLQDDAMVNAAKAYCRLYGRSDAIQTVGVTDLAYFAILGMVAGPVPPRCDEWGNFLGG